MAIETRLPAHWTSLSLSNLIHEAARDYYGQLPDNENLAPLPENADFWTMEDPLDYMWSADTALRMLTQLPGSRRALRRLLNTAKVKYEAGQDELRFRKTWISRMAPPWRWTSSVKSPPAPTAPGTTRKTSLPRTNGSSPVRASVAGDSDDCGKIPAHLTGTA